MNNIFTQSIQDYFSVAYNEIVVFLYHAQNINSMKCWPSDLSAWFFFFWLLRIDKCLTLD